MSDNDAFFGPCSPLEWTDSWAEYVIGDRPNSVVITHADEVVAYMDVPSESIAEGVRVPYRKAFWCGAAGVRADLGAEEAPAVFRQAVWEALRRARGLGYEHVRCAAPWLQHPAFSRPFSEYAGLTIEPFYDDQRRSRYLIEWDLEAALVALEEEGAAIDLKDVFG